MASSSEAFEKFWMWRKSKIWLKVTVIERGQPEDVFSLRVSGLDDDLSLIELVGEVPHSFVQFDVTGADFFLESGRMVVSRDDAEWLIFEEEDSE
jgi:hypothetical protein